MTQSIEGAITSLQSKSTSAGCNGAPLTPPEALGAFPFALAYEVDGLLELTSIGNAHDFPVIRVQHHVDRAILPNAVAAAAVLRDPFLKSIRDDPTLGGVVNTVVRVKRTFGFMKYGDVDTVGYQYDVTLNITLPA